MFLFIHPLFLPFFNHPMNPRFQGLDNVQRLTLPFAAGPLHLRGLPSNPRSARAIVVHKDSSILQAFGLTSDSVSNGCITTFSNELSTITTLLRVADIINFLQVTKINCGDLAATQVDIRCLHCQPHTLRIGAPAISFAE